MQRSTSPEHLLHPYGRGFHAASGSLIKLRAHSLRAHLYLSTITAICLLSLAFLRSAVVLLAFILTAAGAPPATRSPYAALFTFDAVALKHSLLFSFEVVFERSWARRQIVSKPVSILSHNSFSYSGSCILLLQGFLRSSSASKPVSRHARRLRPRLYR